MLGKKLLVYWVLCTILISIVITIYGCIVGNTENFNPWIAMGLMIICSIICVKFVNYRYSNERVLIRLLTKIKKQLDESTELRLYYFKKIQWYYITYDTMSTKEQSIIKNYINNCEVYITLIPFYKLERKNYYKLIKVF